jgi:hypothetical protein
MMSAQKFVRRSIRRIQFAFPPTTFRVSTWLAIGCIIELFISACLPRSFSILLPVLLVAQRAVKATLDSRNIYTKNFTDVHRQRMTTDIFPNKGSSEDEGVVMFVLGARINQ